MSFHAVPPSFLYRLRTNAAAKQARLSILALLATANVALAADVAAQAALPTGATASAKSGSTQGVPSTRPGMVKTASSRPHWRDLNAEQQQALGPLASHWDGLSETHKRKWLVISRNQASLSPAERSVQHSRMTEWAALTRQQREQARFNFDEVKQVPPAERKAKWEAYQALSAEEKRRLADSAAKRPQGAAVTIRPVPVQKLAPVPSSPAAGRPGPRIELAPQPATAIGARPSQASASGEPGTPASAALPPVVPLMSN